MTSAQSTAVAPPRLFPATQAWTLALNNELVAPPAMSGKFGYFPLEGDRLAAYDIDQGTLLWLIAAKPLSQPAIGGDFLFVVEPDAITAFHRQTGSVAWRIPFREPLGVPLVWEGGWLIGATSSGSIRAFRASDGALIWRHEVEGGLRARPTMTGDRLYVSANSGKILALSVSAGDTIWERRVGGQPHEILAFGSRLYVGSTDNYLYAINVSDGEIGWRWRTGGDVIGLPVADEQKVYFVSFDNVLRALDRNSGAQRWKRPLALRPTRGLLRAGDALIVSGVSRSVPAYLLKDGTPAGDLPGSGELAAMPYLLDAGTVPTLVIVTWDFTEGTVLRALKRSYDPTATAIGALPNPIPPPTPPPGSKTTLPTEPPPDTSKTLQRSTAR